MTKPELASAQLVTRRSTAASSGRQGTAWFVGLRGYLLVYISWQLFHWLPFDEVVGHVIEKPIDVEIPVNATLRIARTDAAMLAIVGSVDTFAVTGSRVAISAPPAGEGFDLALRVHLQPRAS